MLKWIFQKGETKTYFVKAVNIYLFTYFSTYLLTPCSTVLLEKLTAFQLVKIFPAFYEARRFITAFTSAHHLSLSWDSSILSIPPYPTFWRSILILSSHLRLGPPCGLFPSSFPTKYTHFLSPIRAAFPTHIIKRNKCVIMYNLLPMYLTSVALKKSDVNYIKPFSKDCHHPYLSLFLCVFYRVGQNTLYAPYFQ